MNSSIESLALWLADFFLAATLLLFAGLAVMYFLRQPAQRLAIGWATMAGLIVLTVLCALPQWPRVSWLPAAEKPVVEIQAEQSANPSEAATDNFHAKRPVFPPRMANPHDAQAVEPTAVTEEEPMVAEEKPAWTVRQCVPWALGFFGGAMGLIAAWLLLGAIQIGWLARRSTGVPEQLAEELERLVGPEHRRPRLLQSQKVAGPIATGIFRPTIILPSQLVEEVHSGRLALILAHEWAHIRNRDLWLLALGRILLLMLFVHPVYWWLLHRVREDQEAVADAEVVDRASRVDYAKELLSWARQTHTQPGVYAAALGIWERPSSLARRIKMLLDETLQIHARCTRRWRCGAMIVATVLTLGVSLLTFQPATLADTDPRSPSQNVAQPPSAVRTDQKQPKATEPRTQPGAAGLHADGGDKKTHLYRFTMTDAVSGKPIPDVKVTIMRWVKSKPDIKNLISIPRHSDAKGNLQFSPSPKLAGDKGVHFLLQASHPDYAPSQGNTFGMTHQEMAKAREKKSPPHQDILMWPADTISGTVVSPDGKPVTDVKIHVMSHPGKPSPSNCFSQTETASDAKGRFEASVVRGGQGRISFDPEHFAPLTKKLPLPHGDLGRIVLKKGIVLSGRVVDIDGKPLAGMVVNTSPMNPPESEMVTEEVEGRDATFGLYAGDATEKSPPASPSESAPEPYRSTEEDETLTLTVDGLYAGEIEGDVYAYTAWHSLDASTQRMAVTDEQGRFTLRPMAAGDYSIGSGYVQKPDGAFAPASAVFLRKLITLAEDHPNPSIELRAVEHVSVAVLATDSEGRPLANGFASINGETKDSPVPFYMSVQTDPQGKAVLLAPKGLTARLQFFVNDAEDRTQGFRRSQNGPMKFGEEFNLGVLDRDIEDFTIVAYKSPTLTLKLVSPDGGPVQGRFMPKIVYSGDVVARIPGSEQFFQEVGDADWFLLFFGSWQTRHLIPGEEFTLTVDAPGYESRSEKMKLAEGAAKEITWQLKPKKEAAKPKIEENAYQGKVTDAKTGKPIRGAKVTVRRRLGTDWNRSSEKETVYQTDADGSFAFAIAPDEAAKEDLLVQLHVTHSGYASPALMEFPLARLRQGIKAGRKPYFERIKMWPGQSVSGTLVDEEGKPVEGVSVHVVSSLEKNAPRRDTSYCVVKTDADGRFKADVIQNALLQIMVNSDDYVDFDKTFEHHHGDLGRLVLKKGLSLRGAVLDAEGKPMPGLQVMVVSIKPVEEKMPPRIDPERELFEPSEPGAKNSVGSADEENVSSASYTYVRTGPVYSANTNAQGQFTMAGMVGGRYSVQIRRTRNNGTDRPMMPAAAFAPMTLTLKEGDTTKDLEIRAVAYATISVRFVDSAGKPISRSYLQVKGSYQDAPFEALEQTDNDGNVSIYVPQGLRDVALSAFGQAGETRWRTTSDSELLNQAQLTWPRVDHDITGLTVVQFRPPTVLVQALDEAGKTIPHAKPRIDYPEGVVPYKHGYPEGVASLSPEHGDCFFEGSRDGRYRSFFLLPEQEFTLTVNAPGYEPRSEKMKLAEGETKKLQWRLEKKRTADTEGRSTKNAF